MKYLPRRKKELVNELKEEAKNAEIVWLASDEDREGKPSHGICMKYNLN